jgi:hypothetical protein
MFSFFGKKECLPRKAFVRALFAAMVLVLGAGLAFVSCGQDPDTNPVNAAQPSISTQPDGGTFDVGEDETFELTVAASVTDGGTISYQWYSNTGNSNSGGTAITTGGSGATLTLAKADYTTNGSYYFFVVVTNTITDNGDGGNKTASRTSTVATVTVSGNGSSEPEVVIPAEIAGYWQTELSYYPGWGFIDDGFVIDATAKTFYYYMDSTLETYWGGTIVRLIEQDDTNNEPAILIIEITDVEGSWYSDPPEEGKYFAAAYKNPTSLAVSSSTAYYSSYNDPNKESPKYPDATDAKNTGVDTIAEAISEYTAANGYFPATMPLYYPHSVTVGTLGDLIGKWAQEDDEDYIINIRGTTYTEFYDDWEENDGIYDPTIEDDMLAAMGDIVDCTDTSQASGIMYIKVIGSDVFTNGNYIAVAWQNKTNDSIEFAAGNNEAATLESIKTSYGSMDVFPTDSFWTYEKQ